MGAMPPLPKAAPRSSHQANTLPVHVPAPPPIRANRAPVLTLRANVVAERLGYPAETALTLDRAVCRVCVRTRAPCSNPGNIRRLGMKSSQHRPAREPRSMRVRIFVLPSSWIPS
jgi:hypothetical protein